MHEMLSWPGLALALAGPGVIAFLSRPASGQVLSVRSGVHWLAAFVLLVASVVIIALAGQKLSWDQIGFAGTSWRSVPLGIALALFFIFVFGPAATAVVTRCAHNGFEGGRKSLATLPSWYLSLTVLLVAGGEEWLYRGYAIDRLESLTGHLGSAGTISLLAFTFAHLPLWGVGVSLTTFVSGGILTVLYIWQRDVSFLILAHILTDLYGLVVRPMTRPSHNKAPRCYRYLSIRLIRRSYAALSHSIR
jgi:uncharacterized protein